MTHDALQELYYYLDHTGETGNMFLAWYAQCRAKEMSHEAAIIETIEHFRLETHDWFQRRLSRFNPSVEYSMATSNVRPLEVIRNGRR